MPMVACMLFHHGTVATLYLMAFRRVSTLESQWSHAMTDRISAETGSEERVQWLSDCCGALAVLDCETSQQKLFDKQIR